MHLMGPRLDRREIHEAGDGRAAIAFANQVQASPNLSRHRDARRVGIGAALEGLDYQPQIVFTTAFDQYVDSTAFELGALDYLLKPFGRERLATCVAPSSKGCLMALPKFRCSPALGSRSNTQARPFESFCSGW